MLLLTNSESSIKGVQHYELKMAESPGICHVSAMHRCDTVQLLIVQLFEVGVQFGEKGEFNVCIL